MIYILYRVFHNNRPKITAFAVELTVYTGRHFQEPLTPVPSHRGPGISGARAGASLEAGDTGRREQASQPTPVHTVQVSDQQCSGDTGPIMLWPTHVRVKLWHVTHTALHCTMNNTTSVYFSTGFSLKIISFQTDPIPFNHSFWGFSTQGNSFVTKSKLQTSCWASWFCFNSFISSAVVVILFA